MNDFDDNTASHTGNTQAEHQAAEGTQAQQQITSDAAVTQKRRRVKITKNLVTEYIMRTLVLCIGLFIMSVGVNLSIQANLGTSPISSIPTVLARVFGFDDIGVTTIVVNAVIALIQIPILRRRYNPVQLLQIPVSTVFGLLCTASSTFLKGITPTAYWDNWLVCIAGIVLVAVGVSIEVATNVTTLAGEGLALSLNKVIPKIKFGYMKVIVDCTLVIIAVAISLCCLHKLYGVREGTLAAAIFVGLIAKLLNKFTIPLADRFFALFRKKSDATETN